MFDSENTGMSYTQWSMKSEIRNYYYITQFREPLFVVQKIGEIGDRGIFMSSSV